MILFTDLSHCRAGVDKCISDLKRGENVSLYLVDDECGCDSVFQQFDGDFSRIGKINRIGKSSTLQAEVLCMLITGAKKKDRVEICFDTKLEKQIIGCLVEDFHDTSFCDSKRFAKRTGGPKKTETLANTSVKNEVVTRKRRGRKPSVLAAKNIDTEKTVINTESVTDEKKAENTTIEKPVTDDTKTKRGRKNIISHELVQLVEQDYADGMKMEEIAKKRGISGATVYNIHMMSSPLPNEEDIISDLVSGKYAKSEMFEKYPELTKRRYSQIAMKIKLRGNKIKLCPFRADAQKEMDELAIGSASIQSDIRISQDDIMTSEDGINYVWNIDANEEIRRVFRKYSFDLTDDKILQIEKIFQYYEIKQRAPFDSLLGDSNKEAEREYFVKVLAQNDFVFPENVLMELYDAFWYFKSLEGEGFGMYE